MNSDEAYLRMPYHIELVWSESGHPDDEAGWFAHVREWPGCMTQAFTPEEIIPQVRDAMLTWIEGQREIGEPIPPPFPDLDYSGQFRLRVPRGLHEALAYEAERQGVSLNQLCATVLAGAVGWQGTIAGRAPERPAAVAEAPAEYGQEVSGSR
ncbi:MAG: type II toxin-antitoxin system HicB family antitoxin [Dehalococcoidia bacterium]|nr:type II toxin-antitoxin system HicB family antitoxin [Dehalococcoidia bacterium]